MSANAPPAAQPWLGNLAETAAPLGIRERELRRRARAGTVPGTVPLGKLLRFNLAAIRTWVDAGAPALDPTGRKSRHAR